MTVLWRLLAALCLALGMAGVVLPVLPTVPFVLLAAWAAGRGWPQLEAWLLAHPRYGPMIMRWRQRRAVPRAAKWSATLGMALSAALLWTAGTPVWLNGAATALMVAVGAWLWRRPDA